MGLVSTAEAAELLGVDGIQEDPFKTLGHIQVDLDLKHWNICIARDLRQQKTDDLACFSLQWHRIAVGGSSTSLADVNFHAVVDGLRLCSANVRHNFIGIGAAAPGEE